MVKKVRLRTILEPSAVTISTNGRNDNIIGAAVHLLSDRSRDPKSSRRDNRDPWHKALRCAAVGGGGRSLPRWQSSTPLRILPRRTAKPDRPSARRLQEEAQTRR